MNSDEPLPKKPYREPKLESFGSVADLTRGANGSAFDNIANSCTPARQPDPTIPPCPFN